MAYEVFQKTLFRTDQPKVSFTTDGRIVLNSAAVRILRKRGVRAVVLLWDRENRKVALVPDVKGNANAYAVSNLSGHSATIRARSFLRYIGWNAAKRTTLPTTWNEKDQMIEFSVPRK